MHTKSTYYISVFIVLIVAASMAVVFGFISPDSWNYIQLAQSLRQGGGCSVNGKYLAVFPCGYPMVIALMSPSTDMLSLVASSKMANFILLAAAFILLLKEIRNPIVAVIIIINPVTLMIFEWTWSENLLLFAFCGVFFSISRLARGEGTYRQVALLGVFLLIGCSSRYFFGPFSTVIFFAVWIAYGRNVVLKALPAFVVSGMFFMMYPKFNIFMTGYSTGMERIPAPETFLFLTFIFIKALARDVLLISAALLVLFCFSFRHLTFRREMQILDPDKSVYLYLALTGIGYLFLAYVLRIFIQYDLYGVRTIGYGAVFMSAALVGRFVQTTRSRPYPLLALLIFGFFSLIFSRELFIHRALQSIINGTYQSPTQLLASYHSPVTDAKTIFSFSMPSISPFISGNKFYYGENVYVASAGAAPYERPETLPEFIRKVRTHAGERCMFDFNPFSSMADFRLHLEQQFMIDVRFSSRSIRPSFLYSPVFDPELKNYLLHIFESGRYVSCADILRKNSV